jgi:hypothetical protein
VHLHQFFAYLSANIFHAILLLRNKTLFYSYNFEGGRYNNKFIISNYIIPIIFFR